MGSCLEAALENVKYKHVSPVFLLQFAVHFEFRTFDLFLRVYFYSSERTQQILLFLKINMIAVVTWFNVRNGWEDMAALRPGSSAAIIPSLY